MDGIYSHDLRGPSIISKRTRARAEKYYSFRYVHPGQLHAPHYRLLDNRDRIAVPSSGLHISQSTHTNLTPIETITPQLLYREAQCWPRPPKYHHRHVDKLDKRGAVMAYEQRRYQDRERKMLLDNLRGIEVEELDCEEEIRCQDKYWRGSAARKCMICEVEREDEEGYEIQYEESAQRDELRINESFDTKAREQRERLVEAALSRWEEARMDELERQGWNFVDHWEEKEDRELRYPDTPDDWVVLQD